MTLERILILDDELVIRKALEEQLRRKRFSVCSVSTLKDAENHLRKDEFDLLFLDVHLPDGNGTEILERIANIPNSPLVVMITGYGTVESAVSCMRAGAFDYIIKPFSSSQIDVLMKKAQDYRQIVKVNEYLSNERTDGVELIGKSESVVRLQDMVRKVAPTEATVLICGENGTGKELVASELYRSSSRRNAPFIKVNCAAVSETLIESEFFGHEKGSYTGATQRREGRFELADGGTILLDEISEISPKVQAKLLRVLQEREFERVGGNKTIKVDVRVVATTNRDLLKSVERGEFRQDLYYRLNVFPIQVPPLRERAGDILLLAKSFLQKLARKHGKRLLGFDAEALRCLESHNWPGNVRELQNTIERAVILSEDNSKVNQSSLGLVMAVSRVNVPSPLPAMAMDSTLYSNNGDSSADYDSGGESAIPQAPSASEPLVVEPLALEEIEKRHILATLESTEGNRTKAAKMLKISIRTLRNKIVLYRKDGEYIPGED